MYYNSSQKNFRKPTQGGVHCYQDLQLYGCLYYLCQSNFPLFFFMQVSKLNAWRKRVHFVRHCVALVLWYKSTIANFLVQINQILTSQFSIHQLRNVLKVYQLKRSGNRLSKYLLSLLEIYLQLSSLDLWQIYETKGLKFANARNATSLALVLNGFNQQFTDS